MLDREHLLISNTKLLGSEFPKNNNKADESTGHYNIAEVENNDGKLNIIQEIFGIAKSYAGMIFQRHRYTLYRKNPNSPVIDGTLRSVTEPIEGYIMLRGNVSLQMDRLKQVRIYFGGEHSGAILLNKNDVARSGSLIIEYQDKKKEYNLACLTPHEQLKLNNLNIFNLLSIAPNTTFVCKIQDKSQNVQ